MRLRLSLLAVASFLLPSIGWAQINVSGSGGASANANNAFTGVNTFAGITTFGGAYGDANTISFNSNTNCIEFEGTTADAFEINICSDNNTDSDNSLIVRGHSFGVGTTAASGDIALGTNINMELAGRMFQYTVSDLMQMGQSATQTNQMFMMGVSAANVFYVSEVADRTFNFAIPTQTNPTAIVTSAAQSTEQRIGMRHNQTQGQIVDLANTATNTRPIGLHGGGTVASAGTITPTGNVFHVSGTTSVTGMTAMASGTCVTVIFDGALTFTDGSNLVLAGNFVTTADDTVSLCSDGTNWYEKGRSVN